MHISGAKIREARQRRGWTQLTLAAQLGTYPARVGLWERGQQSPSGEYALALARALEVDAHDLTADTPEVAR